MRVCATVRICVVLTLCLCIQPCFSAHVARSVSLRHILAVSLAPCITPSCPQAMWEAVSSQDRKLFQPHCWPNICSGFHEESAITLNPPHTHWDFQQLCASHVPPWYAECFHLCLCQFQNWIFVIGIHVVKHNIFGLGWKRFTMSVTES